METTARPPASGSASLLKVWIAMHEALAHLSSRGVHRIIKGSGHEIQLDKPQAVIDAVDEVLRQLQTAGVVLRRSALAVLEAAIAD